jgi:hypothetical protein
MDASVHEVLGQGMTGWFEIACYFAGLVVFDFCAPWSQRTRWAIMGLLLALLFGIRIVVLP